MNKVVYIDMDNTLCDFYGVHDWIPRIQHDDASVYYDAKPFNKYISLLKSYKLAGYKVVILSCLSYDTNEERDRASIYYKYKWLIEHVGLEYIDRIEIVPYTHHKEHHANEAGILIDDDDKVLSWWPWFKVKAIN